ncbi:MAG: hypothetical protein MUF24_00340 [Chitinophagaceae bacterium]|nr:hypothetical protein [Chitinophagaceae bacterium]
MKATVARLLNVKAQESGLVFKLISIQLIMGMGLALLITASYSMLLYNYPASYLPILYLCAAALLFPINALYAWADARFNAFRLLKYVLLLMAAGIALSLGAWLTFRSLGVMLLLLAGNLCIYMVAGYAYWGMASLLFDVREGRRIFAVIGAGDIPSKIIGYALVPLLAKLIGLEGVMALSILFFLGAYVMAVKQLQHAQIGWDEFEHHQHHPPEKGSRYWLKRFFGNRLVLSIGLMSFLGYLLMLLVDFTFLSEIKVRQKTAAELTAFIAGFFLAGRLLALLLKLIFTSRVISYLGLTATLLVTPGLLLLLVVTLLVWGGVSNQPSLYLYGFGVLALFSEVLRSAIQEPVFFVLFQPLGIHDRLKGHLIAKGFMFPPALLAVGLVLGWVVYLHNRVIHIPALLVVVSAILALWMLVIPLVRRLYFETVRKGMGQNKLEQYEFLADDPQVTELLKKQLHHQNPLRVIHALHLLQKSGYNGLAQLLPHMMAHPDAGVRTFALQKMQEHKPDYTIISQLHRLHEQQNQPEAIHEALEAVLCRYDTRFAEQVYKHWQKKPQAIQLALIEGMHSRQESKRCSSLLREMALHTEAAHRNTAAVAIGRYSIVPEAHRLEPLLTDANALVAGSALHAAGLLQQQYAIAPLLSAINHKHTHEAGIKGMLAFGPALFTSSHLHAEKLNTQQVLALVRVAGMQPLHASLPMLTQLLQLHPTLQVLQAVTGVLWKQQHPPTLPQAMRRQLLLLQEKSLSYAAALKQAAQDFAGLPQWQPLAKSLHGGCLLLLEQTLKTAGVLHGKKPMERVIMLIELKSKAHIPLILESIELQMPMVVMATRITKLVEWALLPLEKPAHTDEKKAEKQLEKIWKDRDGLFSPWQKSLACYLAAKNPRPVFARLMQGMATTDPLTREHADYLKQTLQQ